MGISALFLIAFYSTLKSTIRQLSKLKGLFEENYDRVVRNKKLVQSSRQNLLSQDGNRNGGGGTATENRRANYQEMQNPDDSNQGLIGERNESEESELARNNSVFCASAGKNFKLIHPLGGICAYKNQVYDLPRASQLLLLVVTCIHALGIAVAWQDMEEDTSLIGNYIYKGLMAVVVSAWVSIFTLVFRSNYMGKEFRRSSVEEYEEFRSMTPQIRSPNRDQRPLSEDEGMIFGGNAGGERGPRRIPLRPEELGYQDREHTPSSLVDYQKMSGRKNFMKLKSIEEEYEDDRFGLGMGMGMGMGRRNLGDIDTFAPGDSSGFGRRSKQQQRRGNGGNGGDLNDSVLETANDSLNLSHTELLQRGFGGHRGHHMMVDYDEEEMGGDDEMGGGRIGTANSRRSPIRKQRTIQGNLGQQIPRNKMPKMLTGGTERFIMFLVLLNITLTVYVFYKVWGFTENQVMYGCILAGAIVVGDLIVLRILFCFLISMFELIYIKFRDDQEEYIEYLIEQSMYLKLQGTKGSYIELGDGEDDEDGDDLEDGNSPNKSPKKKNKLSRIEETYREDDDLGKIDKISDMLKEKILNQDDADMDKRSTGTDFAFGTTDRFGKEKKEKGMIQWCKH